MTDEQRSDLGRERKLILEFLDNTPDSTATMFLRGDLLSLPEAEEDGYEAAKEWLEGLREEAWSEWLKQANPTGYALTLMLSITNKYRLGRDSYLTKALNADKERMNRLIEVLEDTLEVAMEASDD